MRPILVTALFLCACGGDAPAPALPPAARTSPVLLVGADGLEWDVLLPLLADGRMPHLAGLIERGHHGLLRSFVPTESPVIWTSIATGKPKELHGIETFARVGEDGKPQLFNRTDRRTKALWNILGDRGLEAWVVGWWMTWPVEEIEGVMVAQTNTTDQLAVKGARNVWKGALRADAPGQVHPESFEPRALAVLAEVEGQLETLEETIFGPLPHPHSELGARFWKNSTWAFRADTTYARIASALAQEREVPSLGLVYFGATDVVGHHFWRYREPERYSHPPSAEEIANYGGVIDSVYEHFDRLLGELLAAWPDDTTVLVVSDHGMQAFNFDATFDPHAPRTGDPLNSANHPQAPPGVIVAAGPLLKATDATAVPRERAGLRPLGSVMDLAPTLLSLLGLPLAQDMPGKVVRRLVADEVLAASDARPKVASHDPLGRPWRTRSESFEREDEGERLEQLRALGYLDGEDD